MIRAMTPATGTSRRGAGRGGRATTVAWLTAILLATVLLAPPIAWRRPIQTSAIPPVAIRRTSAYEPNCCTVG